MQSVAKHLYLNTNSLDWMRCAVKMLRCALHDVLDSFTSYFTSGALIWLALRGSCGVSLGAAVGLIGCLIGIAFAEKARRGKGTVEFMSHVIAHPELCEKELPHDPARIK